MLYTENIVYLKSPKQMREVLSTKCRSALMHNDSTKPSWNSVVLCIPTRGVTRLYS